MALRRLSVYVHGFYYADHAHWWCIDCGVLPRLCRWIVDYSTFSQHSQMGCIKSPIKSVHTKGFGQCALCNCPNQWPRRVHLLTQMDCRAMVLCFTRSARKRNLEEPAPTCISHGMLSVPCPVTMGKDRIEDKPKHGEPVISSSFPSTIPLFSPSFLTFPSNGCPRS